MASESADVKSPRTCRLAEIVQYHCDPPHDPADPQWHCLPVIRIFRICKDRPAVELTRFVQVNVETGAVHIPSQSSQVLPKGKPWRDVTRHEHTLGNET
ncbi:hypothetical protein BD414DRAFT_440212 [Trametes punicea]|nr:hypothetical protein BD414DRAFT_440212 [Trametes punicea]